MSKKANLLAASIATILSSGAWAQSSVTLYGSLDAGLAYVNNVGGSSLWEQSSGLLSNTYFGLKGSEDLGGGTRAIFRLESGFDLSNGQTMSSGLFSRQAYVGLENAQAGSVTLGRQYDSIVDYLSPLALAGQAGGVNLAAHPYNNDNIGAQYSFANAVKYQSPNFAGFRAGAMYSFSNSSGFNDGRQWSIGAAYEHGPLKLGAAYDQINHVGAGANVDVTDPIADTQGNPAPINLQRTLGVGGNFDFGPGTIGLLWTHTQMQGIGNTPTGSKMRFDNLEVNGTYVLTPALSAIGDFTYTWAKSTCSTGCGASPKWYSATLGIDYALSKRTDAYVAAAYQHALSYNVDGTEYAVPTSIAGMIPGSSTQNQVAAAVGIRHRF